MTSTDTSRIVPGAPIAVYRRGAIYGEENLTMATVDKVAKQSFTVSGFDGHRFQLRTMESKYGQFSNYVAVAPEHPKVAEVRARDARSRAVSAAKGAVEEWNMGSRRTNPERVQAAIDALTALRDTL